MLKAKYLNAEQIYSLVMECYQSGLTTRQWLAENGMNPSTFYRWVRKFCADSSGCDLPARNECHANPAIPYKQDVVRVDVFPDESGQAIMRQPKETKRLGLISESPKKSLKRAEIFFPALLHIPPQYVIMNVRDI